MLACVPNTLHSPFINTIRERTDLGVPPRQENEDEDVHAAGRAHSGCMCATSTIAFPIGIDNGCYDVAAHSQRQWHMSTKPNHMR